MRAWLPSTVIPVFHHSVPLFSLSSATKSLPCSKANHNTLVELVEYVHRSYHRRRIDCEARACAEARFPRRDLRCPGGDQWEGVIGAGNTGNRSGCTESVRTNGAVSRCLACLLNDGDSECIECGWNGWSGSVFGVCGMCNSTNCVISALPVRPQTACIFAQKVFGRDVGEGVWIVV